MSIKTEYGYNEYDFIERNGQLEELTVTITLGEYRNIIQLEEHLEAEIYNLNERIKELCDEKEDLEERNSFLSKMFLEQHPDYTEMFTDTVGKLFDLLCGIEEKKEEPEKEDEE